MSKGWSDDQKKLYAIIKEKAFLKGDFTLSSGKKSNYYLDCRKITLSSEGVYYTAKIFLDMLKGETFDAIGGPTLGADPMVGALGVVALQNGKPVNTFIIRKEAKAHGGKKLIEGPELKRGSTVVVIDDVATTGKAFLHALDVLDEAGINVNACLCIIDREEGARAAVEARGSKMVSIFTAKDFLNS